MTRINAFIKPAELSDKHLIAEHREIKRIPNTIKSGKARIEGIPDKFTLGKGHVKFFYDKLLWLHTRYMQIYEECKNRGFNVTLYAEAFSAHSPDCLIGKEKYIELYNNWFPDENEIARIRKVVQDRITENNLKKLKTS
jgi:hypothetical protein